MSGTSVLTWQQYETLLEPLTKELSDAARWIAETESGRADFERLRQADQDHQIERVGAELRRQMRWLNPVEVRAGQAQAAAGQVVGSGSGQR